MRKIGEYPQDLRISPDQDGTEYFTYPRCYQNENNCDGYVGILENIYGKRQVRLLLRAVLF
jgi:hypothetical protein